MQNTGKKEDPPARGATLRRLPAVSRLLSHRSFRRLQRSYGTPLVTDLLREHLASLRERILAGGLAEQSLESAVTAGSVAKAVEQAALAVVGPRPRPVINATGIVVHTNLGRAVLSEEAAQRLAASATSYLDLEYDLATGGRGSRLSQIDPVMARLFPGHGFTVVNNNAAAIMLCLRALGRGKEVLVSRGELVEIGGSFRVPDILAASGAKLREVGTTNRTRAGDYEKALSSKTGLILKCHTSNFKIVGFTEEPKIPELARVARRAGIPLVVDWGSGDLVDLEWLGIEDEMPAADVLEAGADLVTFSGDKLLGGPQAGFVVGRADLIERVRKDPLARVCRIDRMLVGALQQTLAAYARGRAFEEVPTLRMLALGPAEIEKRAKRIRREVSRVTGAAKRMSIVDGTSRTGGGSSPTGERPTRLLAVSSPTGDAGAIERRLRLGSPPIIGRVQDGRLLLDLRTVLPEQEPVLIERLGQVLSG